MSPPIFTAVGPIRELTIKTHYRRLNETVFVILEVEGVDRGLMTMDANLYADPLFRAELETMIEAWIVRAVKQAELGVEYVQDLPESKKN